MDGCPQMKRISCIVVYIYIQPSLSLPCTAQQITFSGPQFKVMICQRFINMFSAVSSCDAASLEQSHDRSEKSRQSIKHAIPEALGWLRGKES